jgi:mersacidin/lichenicidin family type 2 lantibiotic
MSNIDIIRAWKDEEYRNSLSEEQRSQLPENPAGMVELSDQEMETFMGGGDNHFGMSCCGSKATNQRKKSLVEGFSLLAEASSLEKSSV